MAQRHLYGPNYIELMPPLEWEEGVQVKATINDKSTEAKMDVSEFTFVGSTADYILEDFIPDYGVFNGCPYRVLAIDDQTQATTIIFDGMLVLRDMTINSKLGPKILQVPLRSLNDNPTIFDLISVVTQGLLQQQGFFTNSDFINVPEVKVSKLNAEDRLVAIGNLGFTIISTFVKAIQDFFSAISDIVGLSVAIGLVELLTLFLNLLLEIQQLVDLITQHLDLLLASQTWKYAVKLRSVIDAAFAKFGYTVEYGIIEPILNKLYVKSSENGDIGNPVPNFPGQKILRREDWGYLVTETLQVVELLFNTRQDVQGSTVHIKNKKDPFWTDSPAVNIDNVKIETTKQYQNGYFRNKTEDVHATWRGAYQYDPSDAWTLTEKNGDSYEVHRETINSLGPKFSLLKGLQDIQIPYAMAVRYDPIDILVDLLQQIFGDFGGLLGDFQGIINQFASYIDSAAGADQDVADFLALSPLNFFFALTAGGLKVEDNTYGIPKLIYGDDTNGILNIPANFKDFIGMEAVYKNWYFPDSPAQENNFAGQYTAVNSWRIPFSLSQYLAAVDNPYFVLDGNNAKFMHINWTEDARSAETEVEVNEVFDQNIKETPVP